MCCRVWWPSFCDNFLQAAGLGVGGGHGLLGPLLDSLLDVQVYFHIFTFFYLFVSDSAMKRRNSEWTRTEKQLVVLVILAFIVIVLLAILLVVNFTIFRQQEVRTTMFLSFLLLIQ